jgi:hypothetical protein
VALPYRVARRRLSAAARPLSVLAFLIASAACRGPTGPIDDDVYVEVMSRLSAVEARLVDRARLDSARAAIFSQWGVTGDELVDYSTQFGGDLARMTRLWDRIRVTADSLEAAEAEALFDDTERGGS